MNNKYNIKETHNVSEASSFEDRKIKSDLKTRTLRNNKTMNNKYRLTIKDNPVQHTSKTHVETPRMRRSTCLSEIKSDLMTRTLRNNKTMNNNDKIKETHNVSEASSFEDRKIKSDLKESALKNNNMNNNNRTTIMDESVPDIGVETLCPTPFRRRVQSLKDTARKVVNKVKKKLNDFNDWIIDYVPPAIRVNPSSAIEKLKNYIKELYKRSPDFTPIEKKAAKGYFKTFTIPGNEYQDPKLYLTDVKQTTTRLIESNLNKGTKVKVTLHCEMIRVDPETKENVTTTCLL